MSTSTHPAPPGAASHRGFGLVGERLRRRAASTETTPMWGKVSFGAILLLAAFLTLWGLSKNGYSNTYYAAAVKSASLSWKALFFGSLDPSSFITVDKPPLSIWLMGLSTRVFGFSSFAMLMPQALCTVGAVALLHATVRRVAGTPAALAAALALALTPITIAIARVNNPDALMILLMVGAGYLLVRALESGKTRFLAWCGVLVGLAFMTKMLQGWMVLPAFAVTYFAFGPGGIGRRTWQLLVAAVTTAVVSAAWPVAVTLWPGSKPFIGGSTNGSVWNLILGYNGLGRITGNESGAGGGGGSPTFGGTAGWLRMFNAEVGAQIAWLLPLAAISLIAGLWMTRKTERTNLRRAGIVMFGLWLVVHFAIFSTQEGIFHPYYTSAMAPAIAALCGIGVVMLFQAAKKSWVALGVLDLSVAGTAWLAMDLMGRATDAPGWAKVVVPAGAVVSIALSPLIRSEKLSARRLVAVAAVAGSLALVAGPASYSFANVGRALNGNNVLAGPAGASSGGFGGGGGAGGGRGGFGGGTPPSGANFGGGTPPSGASGSFTPPSGTAATGATGTATGTGSSTTTGTTGTAASGTTGTQTGGPGGAAGGAGGFGGGSSLSTAAIKYLEENQGSAKYLVAATGSQATASIILATGKNVVTIGGFSGSDPAPTVSQLAAMVKSGELKYVLVGGQGGGGGRGGSSDITSWVEAHGTAVTAVTTSSGTLYKVTA